MTPERRKPSRQQDERDHGIAVPAPGRVARLRGWVVGTTPASAPGGSTVFATSRRCRHQLADLSKGTVDAEGCLVCPWHGSRYDVRDGRMVTGPRGFLAYRGPTPGYSALVRAYSRVLRLRTRRTRVVGDRVGLER